MSETANVDRRAWGSESECQAFKPQLVELIRARAWKRGNAAYQLFREESEKQQELASEAFKLLQKGFFSRGHAALARVQVEESKLKQMRTVEEIALLEALDKLGIDREWKTGNENAGPVEPKLLFHFRGPAPGYVTVCSLDLTAEVNEILG